MNILVSHNEEKNFSAIFKYKVLAHGTKALLDTKSVTVVILPFSTVFNSSEIIINIRTNLTRY